MRVSTFLVSSVLPQCSQSLHLIREEASSFNTSRWYVHDGRIKSVQWWRDGKDICAALPQSRVTAVCPDYVYGANTAYVGMRNSHIKKGSGKARLYKTLWCDDARQRIGGFSLRWCCCFVSASCRVWRSHTLL